MKQESYRVWKRNRYWLNREKELERKRLYRATEAGKLATRDYYERYISEYPERYYARKRVLSALRSGKLIKGLCEVCESSKVEAHHDDYSKPLEVRWLCRKHHMELGRK